MTRDEMAVWIDDLRGRLDRGELRRRRHVEQYAEWTLHQVESWRLATPDERREPGALAAQRQLAVDLAELRAHLVDGAAEPGIVREWRR